MIVSQFGVESWMDQYEEGAKYRAFFAGGRGSHRFYGSLF